MQSLRVRLKALLDSKDDEIVALKQTSAELCSECGWSFFVPGLGCQGCERDRLAKELDVALNKIAELSECLRWYVETDPTWEGDKWEELNAPSLKGKRRAMRVLGMEE
jgi:hypothetical protein